MSGWHEMHKLSSEEKGRRTQKRLKWEKASRQRQLMTDDDLAAEEARLIEEAAIMAAAMGLDDSHIGHKWSRAEGVELHHDGQLSAFRTSERAE
jgi:hypothetical protein